MARPIAGEPVIAAILFYDGSEEEGRNNFKDFLELGKRQSILRTYRPTESAQGPVADHAKEIPYEQLNTLSVRALPVLHKAEVC
jgi:hypothetical protein